MNYVLRRSLPSIGGLIGLLLAVGVAAVAFADFPVWFPAAFALAMVGIQYLFNPWFIQWLVPATRIDHDGERYLTDHRVGDIVAQRCRDARVPLVRLGIVDDGTPNAFTFGRTPKDARIWITRGLLERLDDDELDAVVTHEVGHIRNWDFVVMTVAAAVPLALYYVYAMTRRGSRQTQGVAIGAYVAYVISEFLLLALSRARELAADRWSCLCTGNGDALASALVKIAYGMGQVHAEHRAEVAALLASGKDGKKAAAQADHRFRRAQSLNALGIFDPKQAEALQTAFTQGLDPHRAIAAMRWDVVNPWGPTLEKLSSHPLVARRIQALQDSGLPGRPKLWATLREAAVATPAERTLARTGFATELAMATAPWVVLALAVVVGPLTMSGPARGAVLLAAGLLFLVKQLFRYPTGEFPRTEVTALLERLDAGPVRGIPVEIAGEVIGRGAPGYVLSPDLVVQDVSGFLPLLYRQPIPGGRLWFGLFRVKQFMGDQVVARGWYRRGPAPVLELRVVTTADGRRARCWEWAARYVGAGMLVALGLLVLALGSAAGG